MLSNIKSKIKDFESKSKPPAPASKPSHFSSTEQTQSSPSQPSKRGLGWPWDYPSTLFPLYHHSITSGKLTWLFNWELWRPAGTPKDIEWVPCVRTAAQVKDIDPFLSDITTNQGVQLKHLLGFNEPEIPDQANLSVDEAVMLWRESVLPAKRKFGFRLGSPGMSSDVSRSKPWLNKFFSKLDAEHGIDYLAVHWYGSRWEDMKRFLEDMHTTYQLPLWVNEFACSSMGNGQVTEEDVESFIKQAVPWLDACPWIERYAYFGNGQGRTVGNWVGSASNFLQPGDDREETDGLQLSRIGRLYADL